MQFTTADGVSKRLLTATFASLLILLIVLEALAYVEARSSQREVSDIVTNALRSVELVGQIGMDVQRERTLTDRHILESSVEGMRSIDRDLAANRADFERAAGEYGTLLAFPGELHAWFHLARDVGLKDDLTPGVIALSRLNRDVDARRRLEEMQPLFDSIQGDVARLVAINREGAEHARAELRSHQGRSVRFRIVIGACIAGVLVVFGAILTRVLARNEHQMHEHAVELENKNRELDAFAGRVAHDLRGPLSAISIASHLLAERVPQQSKTTGILQRGVAQMSNLVDELLALSRVGGTADVVGRTEPVAASIAEDLEPRVREAGGTLRIDLQPARVRCSDALLRQVLWNVGENALKYRRKEVAPAISLVGRVARDCYEIVVTDNGIGVSDEDARHLFEPFFRSQRTSSISGTGLGLSIVRRIIDASGGTIAVTSQVGRGTRIAIRLPIAAATT